MHCDGNRSLCEASSSGLDPAIRLHVVFSFRVLALPPVNFRQRQISSARERIVLLHLNYAIERFLGQSWIADRSGFPQGI